jgi:hypothetical protein
VQVTSIDTGAGEIVFDAPVIVGYIVKDRDGVICDDSCEFSLDGVCDDGTLTDDDYYYYYDYDDDNDQNANGYYGNQGPYAPLSYAYDDDYYLLDDGYKVSACVAGTDCTDCGG